MIDLPTHLRVEDRPFFGRTPSEAAIAAVGFLAIVGVWGFGLGTTSLRLVLTVVVAVLCLVLVAVRPAGKRLPTWLAILVVYRATPKRAIWRRTPPVE